MVKRREVVRFFRQNGFKNEGAQITTSSHSEISNQQFEVMKKQAGLK